MVLVIHFFKDVAAIYVLFSFKIKTFMMIGIHVFHDRNLSDNCKLVYAHIIASCLNSTDSFCKDTDAEIAKALGKSKTVVKNSIQQLIEQKHINCEVLQDVRLIWVYFPYRPIK